MDTNKQQAILKSRTVSQDILDWLFLIRDRRWSTAQKRSLLKAFRTPQAIYGRSMGELSRVAQMKTQAANAEVGEATINNDALWLSEKGNHLITLNDERYPQALTEISDPPIALFAQGNLASLNNPLVAMVGSRRPSPVGQKIGNELAFGLAKLGISIVSGLAVGVDALTHQACLQAGTSTIAVMACGLDTIYPAKHRALYNEVVQSGCTLSEYPPGTAPERYRFPQRNRIVSGISLGVIIIEAAERSGTLITARMATEQNRQVMVVPGSVLSAQYKGSNRLLRDGAALIRDINDVLFELSNDLDGFASKPFEFDENAGALQANRPVGDSQPILRYMSDLPSTIDQIVFASGMSAAEVSSMLLMLEVEGIVAATDEGTYVRLD